MLALSFGTHDESQRAADHIKSIHDRVNGVLPVDAGRFPSGTRYSAHDPDLLLWVHVTVLDSTALAYSRFVAPLDDDQIGAYCRDSVRGGLLLGVPADRVPRSRAALEEAVTSTIGSGLLHVTDTARHLAHAVLTPPFETVLRPFARLHRLTTIGLLPPAIREAYELPWSAADAHALARWERHVRAFSRAAPTWLTRWRAARRKN
jgi:uncharacterized protein (DUF2236 family)